MKGVEDTPDIFRYVNFMLPFTVSNANDKPTLDRIAKIGIAPGMTWDLAAMDPVRRKAIEDGVAEGRKAVAENVQKTIDSSKLFFNARDIRRRLSQPHKWRGAGPVGNLSEQAVYQTWAADADGQPLDTSKNNYTVTSAQSVRASAGAKLHQKVFDWQSNTGPQERKDGSVTIYIQRNRPGQIRSPVGCQHPTRHSLPCSVSMAGEAERTAKWKAPPIVRTN